MLTPVTCKTIGSLDHGAAESAINAVIRQGLNDLDDRGSDGKPRKVVIVLEMVKMDEGKGDVALHVEVGLTVPKYRTAGTTSRISRSAEGTQLLFQDLSPDDPRQETIDSRIPNEE